MWGLDTIENGLKGGYNAAKGLVTGSSLSPNNYNADREEQLATKRTTDIYNRAMAPVAAAPTAQITAQNVTAPAPIRTQTVAAPDALKAQTVTASPLMQGPQAAALRQQQLDQAAAAAASPSSAAAQMRAAGTQIENQQLGIAAGARGADRAGARRDAMLGAGTQGMGAASTTAALAAQEYAQKQGAYTAALGGVRTGDVGVAGAGTQVQSLNQSADLTAQGQTAQNQLTAATANQGANLTGQIQTGAQSLNAQEANQGADLSAQTSTIANKQAGYGLTTNANLGQEQVALGATNAQTGAAGVAANYGANENNIQQKTQGSTFGALSSAVGLSDERAKTGVTEIAPFGEKLGSLELAPFGYGREKKEDPLASVKAEVAKDSAIKPGAAAGGMGAGLTMGGGGSGGENGMQHSLLNPGEYGISGPTWGGAGEGGYANPVTGSSFGSGGGGAAGSSLGLAGGEGADLSALNAPASGNLDGMDLLGETSDEAAKHEVERMNPRDVSDWAEAVPTATWRYKPGVPGTDGGQDVHAGTLAHALERTGPLGRLMVHDRGDGLKAVEYGPLGLMVGKGALTKADHALNWAKAAYALAAKGGGLRNG
jgi:hypothetical protein